MHTTLIIILLLITILVALSIYWIKKGKIFSLQAKIKKAELGDLIIKAENTKCEKELEFGYTRVLQLKKEIINLESNIPNKRKKPKQSESNVIFLDELR